MKVRILSGNETGAVVDQPQTVAEANISTGFAELYVEPKPEPEAKPKSKAKAAKKATKRKK